MQYKKRANRRHIFKCGKANSKNLTYSSGAEGTMSKRGGKKSDCLAEETSPVRESRPVINNKKKWHSPEVQLLPRLRSSSSQGNHFTNKNWSNLMNTNTFIPEYMQNAKSSPSPMQFSRESTDSQVTTVGDQQQHIVSNMSTVHSAVRSNGSLRDDDDKGKRDHKTPPPQNSISLTDVMTKLEGLSHLSQKMDSMAEDLKQLNIIQDTTKQIGSDLSETRTNVDHLKESIARLQEAQASSERKRKDFISTISQLKSSITKLEEDRLEAQQNQQALAKELLTLRAQIHRQNTAPILSQMEFEHLKIEAALRRHNLIFEGINERHDDRDTSPAEQVFYFVRDVLGLQGIEIDMAFRLGRPRYGSAFPRPILVRFTRLGDRMAVWNAKYRLNSRRNSHFQIKEDLPTQLRPVQAALMRVVQEAKKFPDRYRYVAIRDFKLFIDGSVYGVEELESLPEELRPSSISTPGNMEVVVFFGKDSKFSNHYTSTFTVDNRSFSTIEQYLAFSRANIVERRDLAERAMASQDPVEAKRVLHLLREEPRQENWESQRRDILFTGLLAKFSQSDDLANYLLSSCDRTLGEASKNRVWGIGMTLSDRAKLNIKQWRGDNLLGNTLMEVRQHLASSSPHSQFNSATASNREHHLPELSQQVPRDQPSLQQSAATSSKTMVIPDGPKVQSKITAS